MTSRHFVEELIRIDIFIEKQLVYQQKKTAKVFLLLSIPWISESSSSKNYLHFQSKGPVYLNANCCSAKRYHAHTKALSAVFFFLNLFSKMNSLNWCERNTREALWLANCLLHFWVVIQKSFFSWKLHAQVGWLQFVVHKNFSFALSILAKTISAHLWPRKLQNGLIITSAWDSAPWIFNEMTNLVWCWSFLSAFICCWKFSYLLQCDQLPSHLS